MVSKETTAEPMVVKALEWRTLDNGTAWSELTSVGLAYFVTTDGTWAHRNGAQNKVGTTIEEAKSAAQQDFTQRILSSLVMP